MRGFQNVMDQGIDLLIQGPVDADHTTSEGSQDTLADAAFRESSLWANQSPERAERSQEEQYAMTQSYGMEDDLGGDDLKVVRWRIVFTKRDYEVHLDSGTDL